MGGVLIAGVANTPAALPALMLSLFWPPRRWVSACAVLAGTGVVIALENVLRRGSVFAFGYDGDHGYPNGLPYSGRPGFSYPLMLGLVSLCFSFGKGVFWFAPGLWLWKKEALDGMSPVVAGFARRCMAFLLGLLLFYASWWSWYGGFCWGPRFLLFASIPASLFLAWSLGQPPRSAAHAGLLLMLLALAVWVGFDGAFFGLESLEECQKDRYVHEYFCWYVPEFSPLVRPFVVSRALTGGELLALGWFGTTLACLGVVPFRDLLQRFNTWRAAR